MVVLSRICRIWLRSKTIAREKVVLSDQGDAHNIFYRTLFYLFLMQKTRSCSWSRHLLISKSTSQFCHALPLFRGHVAKCVDVNIMKERPSWCSRSAICVDFNLFFNLVRSPGEVRYHTSVILSLKSFSLYAIRTIQWTCCMNRCTVCHSEIILQYAWSGPDEIDLLCFERKMHCICRNKQTYICSVVQLFCLEITLGTVSLHVFVHWLTYKVELYHSDGPLW